MNNIRYYCLLLLSVLSFMMMSCQPEPITPPETPGQGDQGPMLSAKTTELTAPASGKTFIVDVTSNRTVQVTSSEDWCVPTLMHDAQKSIHGSLKIVVKKTSEPVVRTADIVLSAEACDDVVITVTQDHRVLSDEKEMTGLTLKMSKNTALKSDVTFKYDAETKTFSAMYLKWMEAENPEMLIPEFESKGVGVFVGDVEVISGKTAISFAEDFTISAKAEDGSTIDYKVVFNCPQINTELAVLHMRPDELIRGKEEYVDTYIELYDKSEGSTSEGWWDSAEKGKIEMRGRGNSTWGLPKKPFRMKFTEKFSPIGLNHAEEKSWALLAQDMDKSLIRTHLAFEYSRILFNEEEDYHHEKCLKFTPCSKFVNVYFTGDYYYSDSGRTLKLDGEYIGVYQMSDQMKRDGGRIEVDKLKEEDGNDPDKITGGYIIETDLHEGNYYTSLKGLKMTYKYPEDDDYHPSQYEYITNFLNQAEALLYSEDFKDPDDGWRKYLDEKSMADFIIIKEFVGDLDGYTSTYMHKRRGVDKIFFGPIWDCDKGWNNDNRVPNPKYKPLESLMIYAGFWMPPYIENDWFQQVWKDEEFRKFVGTRWAAKKAELKAVTDKVLTEVPRDMAKAIEANFTVWPFYYQYNHEANMPARTYELEIQRIRDLSEDREALLDEKFK